MLTRDNWQTLEEVHSTKSSCHALFVRKSHQNLSLSITNRAQKFAHFFLSLRAICRPGRRLSALICRGEPRAAYQIHFKNETREGQV